MDESTTNECVIASRFLQFFGVDDSIFPRMLDILIDSSIEPTISKDSTGLCLTIRLDAFAQIEINAEKLLDKYSEQIIQTVPENYYGEGRYYNLAHHIVSQLKEFNMTLGAAESLTGGGVMKLLTSIPGASEVIMGGYVTYFTEMKHQMLGISNKILAENSVVSEEVALEMAKGTYNNMGCDVAIALTGVAGPGSLDNHKPGTVFIAAYGNNISAEVKQLQIPYKSREMTRDIACLEALNLLREKFNKYRTNVRV